MDSEIRTYFYPNGDIQRVQLVRWDDWSKLDFLHMNYGTGALDCFYDIYRKFLVPACPWIFGTMVMFRIPEDMDVPFSFETKKYGAVAERLTAATAALQQGVTILGGKPIFKNEQVKNFWKLLEERNCLRLVRGKLPTTAFIPVGDAPGYLTEEIDAPLKVNASFFIMDRFDCATVYDHVGTPIGLCVKNGVVMNPPLFRREALLVRKDGTVSIETPDIREMDMEVNGLHFIHGQNARIYTRPERTKTPGGSGKKLIIIGDRVAAVCNGGSTPIPASGFAMVAEGNCSVSPGDRVIYHGMEDVLFGIQVGNSILRNGVKTDRFLSRFYNIYRLEPVPFPPSLYPVNFQNARAARIALGADKGGKPMLLWAEGAGKLAYESGKESCGASLPELAEICADAGMENAVNLDGGGSAQILLQNHRSLKISDRKESDNTEAERPVPLALIIR